MVQTVAAVASQALRHHGAFGVNQQAPDPEQLAVAIQVMENIVNEFTGTHDAPWLSSTIKSIDLTKSQKSINLVSAGYTKQQVQFLVQANLYRNSQFVQELTQVLRSEYEADMFKESTGTPTMVVVDRVVENPTAYVAPAPGDDSYAIEFRFQAYTPDITKDPSNISHGFDRAWERYLALRTAHDCGMGPIAWLPDERLRRLAEQAAAAERQLRGFNQQETRFHEVRPWTGYFDTPEPRTD